MANAKPIPDGYHTVTPSFTFKDCKKAIEFYKKAFGGKNAQVFPTPDGKRTMHATIEIGNSIIMMGDEWPGMCTSAETQGDSPIGLYIYVEDADKLFNQAVAAGATSVMPMSDAFWGDRCGCVKDPFGYKWNIGRSRKARKLSSRKWQTSNF
jgi:uncharacterized glyoxalase superfamily protein PhnB